MYWNRHYHAHVDPCGSWDILTWARRNEWGSLLLCHQHGHDSRWKKQHFEFAAVAWVGWSTCYHDHTLTHSYFPFHLKSCHCCSNSMNVFTGANFKPKLNFTLKLFPSCNDQQGAFQGVCRPAMLCTIVREQKGKKKQPQTDLNERFGIGIPSCFVLYSTFIFILSQWWPFYSSSLRMLLLLTSYEILFIRINCVAKSVSEFKFT